MALRAVVFDVGETLVDETRLWERAADAAGVPRFTLMGVVGGLAARGERHDAAWQVLGVERPASEVGELDLYADALPCIERLRSRGLLVAAVGNTPASAESLLRGHVDLVGSSARWGVEKPDRAFFERMLEEAACTEPSELAYVGDRVDNDVAPALKVGIAAVHIRRGPWGHLHDPPPEAIGIRSLDELPEALGV